MGKAKYYLLTADHFTGEETERTNLVSMAVEDSDVESKAVDVASRLAEWTPRAIRWTKQSLHSWLRQVGRKPESLGSCECR
jgi:enoyl-CoA hydratase